MGKGTLISWSDDTVNPVSGCDGCELWKVGVGGPCYAGPLHQNRLAKSLPHLYAPNFDEVRLIPGRMAKAVAAKDLTGTARPGNPWLDGRPRVIFVGDLGDVMSKAVPFEFLRDEVVANAVSPNGRRHILMLLTKRPSRLLQFAEWLDRQGITWPANLWAGTSITGEASRPRVEALAKLEGPDVRFLSMEPLREHYDLTSYVGADQAFGLVIVGGESRQGGWEPRPFDIQWAISVIDYGKMAGVPVHVKQLGAKPFDSASRISIDGPGSHAKALDFRDSHGADWSEWPEALRVREFPEVGVHA